MTPGQYLFLIVDSTVHWTLGRIDSSGEVWIGGVNYCKCETFKTIAVSEGTVWSMIPTIEDVMTVVHVVRATAVIDPTTLIDAIRRSVILSSTRTATINADTLLLEALHSSIIINS